eukprot:m51a1_g8355 hypothetical protein (211) ;mRNA; f:63457-64228
MPDRAEWQRRLGNPAPLGLFGQGFALTFYGFRNAGLIPFNSSLDLEWPTLIWAGIAMVLAGVLEYVKGNTYAAAVFVPGGCSWITLALIYILPLNAAFPPASSSSLALYYLWWTLWSGLMWVGSGKKPVVMQLVLLGVWVRFLLWCVLESLNTWGEPRAAGTVRNVAGYWSIVVGFLSFYLAAAEMNGWPTLSPFNPVSPKGHADLELPA